MPTRLPILLLGLATVVTLTSCTTPSAGEPTPETSSAPSGTSESDEPDGDDLPSHGAPKVENPLDVSEFEEEPCKSLTQQQAQDLNVPESQPDENQFGKLCRWGSPEILSGNLTVGFMSEVKRGLSSVYEENEKDRLKYFEKLPKIEGYPAVAWDTGHADPLGTCAVSVGVADELSFVIILQLSDANVGHKDPCDTAATVASLVLQNMKGE